MREQRLLLLDLRDEGLTPPRELGNPVPAGSFGKACFLRGELSSAQALVSFGKRGFRLFARPIGNVTLQRFVVQARLQIGDPGVDRSLCLQFGIVLAGDVRGLVGNLRTALFRRLGRLPELHELELQVVTAALLRREREAFIVIRLLVFLQLEFDGIERPSRVGGSARRSGDCTRKLVQFPLAREHAVQLAVGREQGNALCGHQVSFGRHERFARSQRVALRERRREIRATADSVESVGQPARDLRLAQLHFGEQGIGERGRP